MRCRSAASCAAGIALAAALAGCASLPTEVTVPETVTAPGTSFELGETVRVPGQQWGPEGGTDDVEVGLTVLDVRAESPDLFDRLDNASELDGLAGVTPVVVVSQIDVTPDSPGATAPSTGGVVGVLASGDPAEFVTTTNQPRVCGTPATDVSLPTDVRCTIVLVPAGESLSEVAWGLLPIEVGQNGPDGRTAAYTAAPITWQVPEITG